MAESVRASKYTVIAVRYSDKSEDAAAMNWWIEETPLHFRQERENSIKVSGIPAFVPKEAVLRIFNKCGSIRWSSRVSVGGDDGGSSKDEPSHLPSFRFTLGGYCVYIQFASRSAVSKALSMKYEGGYTVCRDNDKPAPLSEVWCGELEAAYDCDTDRLRETCTEYMKEYDQKQLQKEEKNKKVSEEADDEGWVTVTRTKTSRPPKAVKAHELRKRKKNHTLLHFYKNQVADSKMQKIRELKAKFEEDKKRIQEMRQQRKFRPY